MAQGRKPKHPDLRLVEGNREHRPIKADVPRPASKRPPCPKILGKEARKAWMYLCRQLEAMGTIGSSDQALMAGYCQQWEIMVLAQRRLYEAARQHDESQATKAAAEGKAPPPARMVDGDWSSAMVIPTTAGNLIQSPLLGIANAAWEKCCRYASILGCSPSDRARMGQLPTGDKGSLLDELLG